MNFVRYMGVSVLAMIYGVPSELNQLIPVKELVLALNLKSL